MFSFPVFSCFHQFQRNLSRGTHDKYVLVNFTLPLQNPFKCSLSNQIHAPSLQYKHREVWNMFKANNWSTKTSKKSFWCFIVNFERISYLLLVFVFEQQCSQGQANGLTLYHTPWKHQKTFGVLVFSGGMKWEHWPEMDFWLR